MLFALISLSYFFGAIGILYPVYVIFLFVIYKLTDGKRNFRSWWSLMKYQI